MKKTHFLQKKLDFEKEYNVWANTTPERKAKYADIISKEKAQYDLLRKTKDRDNVAIILQNFSGIALLFANQIYDYAREMEKPVAERNPLLSFRIFQVLHCFLPIRSTIMPGKWRNQWLKETLA